MNLHNSDKEFYDAIRATAQYLKMREVYIEKDYWVTLTLKRLANSEFRELAIFKGGTSLSKAMKCIQRFSEDIDLAIIAEGKSSNQIKKLISTVQKEITDGIPEVEVTGITSKGSKFRKTVHEYKRVVESADFGQGTDKLLIEVNSFASPHPYSPQTIQSYICDFFQATGKEEFIERYELESFEVLVLDIERTFTEKIMGLIRASYNSSPEDELKKKIRHIYDINKILEVEGMLDFLNSELFFEMINRVRKDDAENHEFNGDWMRNPLSSNLLFKNPYAIWDQLEKTYKEEFSGLVFGELPSSESIIESLVQISKRLTEFDNQK